MATSKKFTQAEKDYLNSIMAAADLTFDATFPGAGTPASPFTLTPVITAIRGGYTGTMQDLYNLITAGNVTPAAPTGGVVDDTANTFGFTVNPTYAALSDYEYRINAGAWTVVTANPISVGNIAVAIGALEVRVKAATGRNVSVALINATAFAVGGVALSSKFIDNGLASGTSTYNGQVFEPDIAYLTTAGTSSLYTDNTAVANTAYSDFYRSMRYSDNVHPSLTFGSLTNGNYTVYLHYQSFSAGATFIITINGTQVANNVNIATEAGGTARAWIKSFIVTVSDGQIIIAHTNISGNLCLAGIEIVAQGIASKLV